MKARPQRLSPAKPRKPSKVWIFDTTIKGWKSYAVKEIKAIANVEGFGRTAICSSREFFATKDERMQVGDYVTVHCSDHAIPEPQEEKGSATSPDSNRRAGGLRVEEKG